VGSRLGIAAILLGVLFAALEGNEWMRQGVMEAAAPPTLDLPAAVCPEDELEEEGLSAAECEQLVSDVRSYLASRPAWFFEVQTALTGLGTLLAILSIVAGAWLVNGRVGGAGFGLLVYATLSVIDVGHFTAAQLAGPILRGIHLPPALFWFFVHLALALACHVARQRERMPAGAAETARAYGRFEIATHWFVAVSVFFLFVSSWWMLALPLPSEDFRFREFPFQLHKNLGITIMLLLVAMALIRILRRQALAAVPDESSLARQLRLSGHVALYVLIFAVCVTGFMSSTYSGWTTTYWWLYDLPYWGHENEELNQLYSDLHFWSCWGLLLAMAAHIGAALLHAFRDDGIVRRILRW
jgi:cytochrome b561